MSSAPDEFPKSLVSAKLQGVALRTPPPQDTYVLECFTWTLDQDGALGDRKQRIVRVAHSATVLQVLHSLGLIAEAVAATPDAAKCLSTTSGGIRTQMFVVRAAAGDGTPHSSLPEADLCSQAPLRDAINLRFPFAIAIVPVLRDPATQQWGAAEWTAALTKLHRQNLVAENRAHDESATDTSPTTVAALLRSSDSLQVHRVEARQASVRPAPLLPLPMLEQPDAHIVVSQPQLLPSSSSLGHAARPSGQAFDSGLFAAASQSRPDLLNSAYSTSTTPRTPNRRRASSVSVQDDDAAAAASAAAAAATTTSSPFQPAVADASRMSSILTRKERRAAAEAERARLAELQAIRERNIAAIERRRATKSVEIQHHVVERESSRAADVEEIRKQETFRLEKMKSRDKLTLQSKRDLLERYAAREMEAKVEMHRLIEATREQLFPLVSTASGRASSSDPFLPFSTEVLDSIGSEQRTSATLNSQRLSITGAREHRSKSRTLSTVELPIGEESELARFEKEQGKTSFVNRVAAARKAMERRMSKFSTVKYHPFAVHAELQSLMHSLDATAHEFVHKEEAAREVERAAERERNTAEYHERVMKDNIAQRVQLKMERKRSLLDHHAQQIAFEKVKKEEQLAAQHAADNAAKQRILKFYDRKRQQEEDAALMAERERALETYVAHQKQMLESLVAQGGQGH